MTPETPDLEIPLEKRAEIWARWQDVAPPRMSVYADARDTCPLDPAGRYIWANHLSAAISPALHTFEIAFRNAIHSSLTDYYRRADWFNVPRMFKADELKKVSKAKQNALSKARRKGRNLTPDDVIAEFMFGFWSSLLNAPYDTKVFRPCLARRFRSLPAPFLQRTDLHSKVLEFSRVRNRVFHHEPIWNFPGIEQIEAELWSLSEALYPEYGILSQQQARFQGLFHDRASFKTALEHHLSECLSEGRITL